MAEEIAVENDSISNFKGLMSLTLNLHTIVYYPSTSTYMTNFIEIEETFRGWTDGRMGRRTFESPLLGRLRRVDLKTKARFSRILRHPA